MYVTYNNLFKLLIDKGLNKTEFAREVGISSNTLAKLSKMSSSRLRCSCASAVSSTALLATSYRSRRAKRRSKTA